MCVFVYLLKIFEKKNNSQQQIKYMQPRNKKNTKKKNNYMQVLGKQIVKCAKYIFIPVHKNRLAFLYKHI